MKVKESADKWIEYHHTNDDSLSSVVVKMDELVVVNAERAWQIILAILKRDSSDTILSNLAAGPLEDLLVEHGNLVIDRVEVKAKQDPDFTKLIMGVWQNAMSEDIWLRVEALQSLDSKASNENNNAAC